MNCKQTEELLPLYAGRELEEKRAMLVNAHLQTCAACARVADEYHEAVQLTGQFAPPIFSDAVYAGIRQRVLREIQTEALAPAWSQTIATSFRSRLTWATAGVLLIVVSIFAIYSVIDRGNVEQRLANRPANVEHGTKERSTPPASVNTGGEKQKLASVPQLQRRKRSRATLADRMSTVSPQPGSLPEPMLLPNSASLVKPLRMEIQTKDPMIRIIWFVQPETKPVIPGPKGT